MGTSYFRNAQLLAELTNMSQSVQSIIGTTLTRRSSETADSTAKGHMNTCGSMAAGSQVSSVHVRYSGLE
jgi:hypothetical protein